MTDLAALKLSLEQLRAIRRSGTSHVAYEGKSVDHRTDAELQAAIASLESEIATAEGTTPSRSIVVRSHKGW